MSEVEVLYKCLVCGKAFSSRQALRGHMNAHRGKLKRTTVFATEDDLVYLKGYARRHNTTTCQLFRAFIKMVREGEKRGVITVGGPNPVIFQLQQNFLGKPRSVWEQEFDLERLRSLQRRCPMCGSRDIREFQPEGTILLHGRCHACDKEWLIGPVAKR